jgi:hypothetical protein
LLCLIIGASAFPDSPDTVTEPAVYFNFNEGSGTLALGGAGHGNAGTLHGASRIENGGCGGALAFDGVGSYVAIPFSTENHPEKELTVSTWFFTDSYRPQMLVSGYREGGYRLGFDDGRDLWWTVSLERTGDVSVPVQHEGISLNQWHHVTGTYNGQTLKIYLDGVLRNQVNATGTIHYQYGNYVMLGANAGTGDEPDTDCPDYFRGGLDEVRVYARALTYGQVMDDRFRCSQEPVPPARNLQVQEHSALCNRPSGSVQLGGGVPVVRTLAFEDQTTTGTWNVSLPPGSKLIVNARDAYPKAHPDAWYVEISDDHGRITRTIAFPNTNNAPAEGVIPSGKAMVLIRYFDGKERFPAKVSVQFESIELPPPPAIPQNIFANPIIVIYTASWATLIALILVIVWLHRRRQQKNSIQ